MSDTVLIALQVAGGLVAGMVLGHLHFRSLHRVSADYLAGHPGRALALQMARLAGLGIVLFGLARIGAPCLLAGAAGIWIARRLVMRHLAGEAP